MIVVTSFQDIGCLYDIISIKRKNIECQSTVEEVFCWILITITSDAPGSIDYLDVGAGQFLQLAWLDCRFSPRMPWHFLGPQNQ